MDIPTHLEGLGRLDGKRALVTGANSGIGKQIAANLVDLGAEVILACRSPERGEATRAELAERGEVAVVALDQSSQASVRACADEIIDRFERLDILVNNAGIYPDRRELSVDGIELTWATNVLGYFQLTRLLEPALRAAAPSRVLFIASKLAGGLDLDDPQFERRSFGGIKAYKQSKQANRMLARRFADRLADPDPDKAITVATIHPGGIRTGIGRHQRGLWGLLVRVAFRTQKPVTAGADTATWLATLPAAELPTGRFWANRAERPCEFEDREAEERLWQQCEALVTG